MRNLNLNYEGYEDNLVGRFDRPEIGGVQYRFRFENNYGASIVKHDYSYGRDDDLWELGVISYRGNDWDLDYDTDITGDVIGWLTDEEVRNLLQRIKDL